ncbi:hypothetical protein U1Q18_001823 [Sarracenia purpurea var. burkii]
MDISDSKIFCENNPIPHRPTFHHVAVHALLDRFCLRGYNPSLVIPHHCANTVISFYANSPIYIDLDKIAVRGGPFDIQGDALFRAIHSLRLQLRDRLRGEDFVSRQSTHLSPTASLRPPFFRQPSQPEPVAAASLVIVAPPTPPVAALLDPSVRAPCVTPPQPPTVAP